MVEAKGSLGFLRNINNRYNEEMTKAVDQARRQVGAIDREVALGLRATPRELVWHFAEQDVANDFRARVAAAGLGERVAVRFTPLPESLRGTVAPSVSAPR